jgi:hypothetical protein
MSKENVQHNFLFSFAFFIFVWIFAQKKHGRFQHAPKLWKDDILEKLSYLVYSQIGINLQMDDCHLATSQNGKNNIGLAS